MSPPKWTSHSHNEAGPPILKQRTPPPPVTHSTQQCGGCHGDEDDEDEDEDQNDVCLCGTGRLCHTSPCSLLFHDEYLTEKKSPKSDVKICFISNLYL